MKNEKIIQEVVGGGKTEEILNKADKDSLIITKTITLSQYISRKLNTSIKVIHYHQLIWNTAKEIGIPLSLDSWDKYQDEFIFEDNKENIKQYSNLFIDIDENDLEEVWIKILKRYFLKKDGLIYKLKNLNEGESFRLNSSVLKLINKFDNNLKLTGKNNFFEKTFYIQTNKDNLIDDISKILQIEDEKKVTILTSELETIKYIEENLDIPAHLSFLSNEEERMLGSNSLSHHWEKKNRSISFDSQIEKLKLSTIESFKGLESEIIFFILTPNTFEKDIFNAITRTKDKLYIFNCENDFYSDILKLHSDKVISYKNEFDETIFITLLPSLKEKIKEKYKLDDYKLFFERIFPNNQSLEVYNYNNQKMAITNKYTDIVLITEQNINKFKQLDNYLFCFRIEDKNRFILNEKQELNIKLSVFDNSYRNYYNSDIDVFQLWEEVKELTQILPIEDTKEYKKWKIYLCLLEKVLIKNNEFFSVKLQFNDGLVSFKKPKNIKIEENDELLILNIDENNFEEKTDKFGEVLKVTNKKVYVTIKDKYYNLSEAELKVNNIGEKSKLDILKKGLDKIKFHPFKFYIFGNKKLPEIKNLETLNIEFKNKNLNDIQKEAIKKALCSDEIFMIQGPPGTGKTSVIAEIVYQEMKKGHKVLVSSESNDAIENALERLNEKIFYPILIQSKSRENKIEFFEDLPIEKNIGNFYKKRILDNLKNKLNFTKNMENELNNLKLDFENKEEKIIFQIEKFKEIEDDEDLIKNYIRSKKINLKNLKENYQKQLKEMKRQNIFFDIQQQFFYEFEKDNNESVEKELSEIYINKVNVIGATLNQIDKVVKNYNNSKQFDVIIVDEVSKATPIELNLVILNGKKIILVGDQKQLPPMLNRDISLEEFAENIFKESDEDYKSEEEVKKELHQHKTIFENLIENNPHSYIQLRTQYRMHKKIQEAINHFYDENLICGTLETNLENKHKLFKGENLVWVDSSFSREKRVGTSFENLDEIEKIKQILEKLEEEYQDIDFIPTIGVISFYGKQVNHLNKIENKFKNLKVDFGTVDSFQGQERDFIIVSMVRSNDNLDIGFARSLNRINVAFSRVKQLLIIVGSAKTFTQNKSLKDTDIKKAKEIYRKIYEISYKGNLNDY